MIPQHDTDWALSAKGNWWRRIKGTLLIVGETESNRIWARVGGNFLEGEYDSLSEAQTACEQECEQ